MFSVNWHILLPCVDFFNAEFRSFLNSYSAAPGHSVFDFEMLGFLRTYVFENKSYKYNFWYQKRNREMCVLRALAFKAILEMLVNFQEQVLWYFIGIMYCKVNSSARRFRLRQWSQTRFRPSAIPVVIQKQQTMESYFHNHLFTFEPKCLLSFESGEKNCYTDSRKRKPVCLCVTQWPHFLKSLYKYDCCV